MFVDLDPGKNRSHLTARSNPDGSFVLKGLLPCYYEIDAHPADPAATVPYTTSAILGFLETILDASISPARRPRPCG
jgi:hypothetical protein